MDQSDILPPEVTSGAGYSFVYSLYLRIIAWLLRKAVARYTGRGSLFTTHVCVDTPGLGEGRVKCSVCVPQNAEQLKHPLPLVLVFEGGGFILGQPSDGERNVRMLSDKVSVTRSRVSDFHC